MRTTGQKILITGGGSGIGLALARRLAPDNMVVIAGRDEAKLARARDGTPGMRSLRLDVTSEEEASRAVAWLAEEIGGLSILVNNAGTMNGSRFESEDAAAAEADVQINLLGTVRMTR